MSRFVVFSQNALAEFIEEHREELPMQLSNGEVIAQDTVVVEIEDDTYVLARQDLDSSQFRAIALASLDLLSAQPSSTFSRALARVDRVAGEISRPPVHLPSSWRTWHLGRLLAFFALPQIHSGLRWIVEELPGGSSIFWELYDRHSVIELSDFVTQPAEVERLTRNFALAITRASSLLPAPSQSAPGQLRPMIDLEAVGPRAVTQGRSYGAWSSFLTDGQLAVLQYSAPEALKIRGPAGSGKTLTLELKALQEAMAENGSGEHLRVLFATHSWALANQVDTALHQLDESGRAVDCIEVWPLVYLRELIQGELPLGVEMLGEDSLDGKRKQLTLISESIDAIKGSDWVTYVEAVSDDLRRGVETASSSNDRLALVWDLMREFIEVFDPNELKPGIESLQRYIGLPRANWMVRLETQADREFVFGVYREYVARLVSEGQITTDQALDDFRRYLESYTWNIRRGSDGYDLIIVDEFHLFNDTERYILHLLSRDANSYPRIVMALDPYQSPYALLTGGNTPRTVSAQGQVWPTRGREQFISLRTTHRFSPEVLQFVSHVHRSLPNLLELGDDWDIAIQDAQEPIDRRRLPEVKVMSSIESLQRFVFEEAHRLNDRAAGDERTAIIGVGHSDLELLKSYAQSPDIRDGVTVVESRDDAELLRYSRRTIVITSAEYAAGLQFANVVMASFTGKGDSGFSTSSQRVFVSELYLAASRCERTLKMVMIRGNEGFGDIAQDAIRAGVAIAV